MGTNPRREIEMEAKKKITRFISKSRTNPKREIEHRKKKNPAKKIKNPAKNKKNLQAYK